MVFLALTDSRFWPAIAGEATRYWAMAPTWNGGARFCLPRREVCGYVSVWVCEQGKQQIDPAEKYVGM